VEAGVDIAQVQRRVKVPTQTSIVLRFGGFFDVGLFVIPALISPFLLFRYLIGTFHEHPFTMNGQFYPDGGFLFDFHVMWNAGHAIVLGHSPYPFVYPAPAAILMVPFGALPWKVAVVAFALGLYASAFFTLRLLGVRDWRCYGAALGSLPGVTAVTAGTLSWPLALGAALVWRYRHKRWVVAAAIVGVIVTKLFLWPLVVWLIATRRFRTALTTVGLGIVVVFGSWAVIGFDGLLEYPRRLGGIASVEQEKGWSLFPLMRSLGVPPSTAHLVLVFLTLAAVAGIVLIARRPDGDRRAFAVAVGAALLLAPIVWPHYLVLLFVVLALFRQSLSAAWTVPLLYWVLPYWVFHGSRGHAWSILIAFAITLLGALAARRAQTGTASPA
jgi:hypothetical protein